MEQDGTTPNLSLSADKIGKQTPAQFDVTQLDVGQKVCICMDVGVFHNMLKVV